MLREMKKLLSVTGSGIKYLFLILLRCPVDTAMTVVQAVFLQQAFNALAQTDGSRLTAACLIFAGESLCLFLYNGFVRNAYAPFIVRMEGKLRIALFQKIAAFSYERIDAHAQGEWLTRLNADVQMPFSQPFPLAACAIVNICASAILVWRISPLMAGWVILFLTAHIILNQLLVAGAMTQLNIKSLEARAGNTDELTAMITCADIAALYDGQDYLIKRFEHSSLRLLRANMRIRKRNALGDAVRPLFNLGGYLVLLIIGSAWIADGRIAFGDLTAVFQYSAGLLSGSLMLSNSLVLIQAALAGIRRLNETMAEETEDSYG